MALLRMPMGQSCTCNDAEASWLVEALYQVAVASTEEFLACREANHHQQRKQHQGACLIDDQDRGKAETGIRTSMKSGQKQKGNL